MTAKPRRSDWETPAWLFDKLHAEFDFSIDAAAHEGNHKLARYWGPDADGLSQNWTPERVWCNPPYGRGIGEWVRKGRESGGLVVMLIPVRSETTWWCDHVIHASEIRFVRGRVHFLIDGGSNQHPKGSRPVFSSAVVIFGAGDGPRLGTFPTPQIERMQRQGRLLV